MGPMVERQVHEVSRRKRRARFACGLLKKPQRVIVTANSGLALNCDGVPDGPTVIQFPQPHGARDAPDAIAAEVANLPPSFSSGASIDVR
jgi:hypothetical protein